MLRVTGPLKSFFRFIVFTFRRTNNKKIQALKSVNAFYAKSIYKYMKNKLLEHF